MLIILQVIEHLGLKAQRCVTMFDIDTFESLVKASEHVDVISLFLACIL